MRCRPVIKKQEAFEKCWAHSPLRAATLAFTRCRYCRTPPAHRCPQRRRQQQRQRVTEGTAHWAHRMGPITHTHTHTHTHLELGQCSLDHVGVLGMVRRLLRLCRTARTLLGRRLGLGRSRRRCSRVRHLPNVLRLSQTRTKTDRNFHVAPYVSLRSN